MEKANQRYDKINLDFELQMMQNCIQNIKIGNSELRLIGDKIVLILIIKLLAYIRHALLNNIKTNIDVKIGLKIANVDFKFDVNLLQIDDLIPQKEIIIS